MIRNLWINFRYGVSLAYGWRYAVVHPREVLGCVWRTAKVK